ncbi:MAG: SusC/RagA family TonB-linked outer membrane protein [Bacteroidota bacterium]
MRKQITLFALFCVFLCMQSFAQDRTLTGKVTSSEDNLGIPGVSVVVVGTTIGTTTDIDGNYKLNVPSGAKQLRFSGVGLKSTSIDIGASDALNLAMVNDVLKLDEVVVTALGISKEKKALGYAVQEVSGGELARSGETNLVEALSSKVAGVNVISSTGTPGASSYITIRGAHSITGENQPLFVLDGIPVDNSSFVSGNPDEGRNNLPVGGVANSNRLIDLNADDIESVTVLKGPAAAALYGIRAANGAIIITSKKGHYTVGKPIHVDFSTSLSWEMVNKLPDLQNTYSQGSNGLYSDPSTLNRNSWGPAISTLGYDHDIPNAYNNFGTIVPINDPGVDEAAKTYDPYDFFETGTTANNNISFSGGNETSNFIVSIAHLGQKGIVPNSTFKRTSVRVGGGTEISKKIHVNGTITYSKSGGSRIQQGSNVSGVMLGLTRTAPTFDNTNGSNDPVNDESAYELPDGTPRSYRPGIYDNPYWTVNKNPFNDDVNRMIGNTAIVYDPASWANITYRVGTDFYSDRRKAAFEIGSGNLPAGQVFEDQHYQRDFNSDLFLTLKKRFGANFGGSLLLGNNMYSTYHQQLYSQGDGLNIPGFYQMSNAQSVLSKEEQAKKRTAAFYLDLEADYKSMLYIGFTGRNEWSTSLPNASTNSFFYPAVNLGFVFTEPLKMADNKYFPYGKLRFSYAQVGNDAPIYSTFNTYESSGYGDGWASGIFYPYAGQSGFDRYPQLANSKLKPETTTSLEYGVELKFLKNRLGVDFTYYDSKSDGQILPVDVAGSSGYRTVILNSGSISNKGIELGAYITPLMSKSFKWDINLNYSKNKNKVESLAEGLESLSLGGFETPGSRAVVGQPFGVIYGGQWLRDDNGNIVIDDEGDASTNPNFGFPVADPKEGVIGDPNPDWLMGIRNTFTYKGWSLTGLLDIRHGGDIWNGTEGALVSIGTSATTENRGETKVWEGVSGHLDADGNLVSSGQTNSTTVVLDENWYRKGNGSGFGPIGEQFIEDGGWVRLREISLAYHLNPKYLKKTPFASIDISISGRNVWLKTDYKGVDPETNLTGTGSFRAEGFEYFNMPNTKSYGFSIRLTL